MGRNIGRHAHRDPGGAIGQQVGIRRRQKRGFLARAVKVVAKIDRVFGQTVHQFGARQRHARLGITIGSGVIAIDITEVPLPVDQRVADRKFLGQAHQRVVNRAIPVGVIVAHRVAHDLGDTPMHRL